MLVPLNIDKILPATRNADGSSAKSSALVSRIWELQPQLRTTSLAVSDKFAISAEVTIYECSSGAPFS